MFSFSFRLDDRSFKEILTNLKDKNKQLRKVQKKAINKSLSFLQKEYKKALKSELKIKDKNILKYACRLGVYKDKSRKKSAERTLYNIGNSDKGIINKKKYFLVANILSEGSKSRETALKKNRGHIKSRGSIFTSTMENNKSKAMQILQQQLQEGLSEN